MADKQKSIIAALSGLCVILLVILIVVLVTTGSKDKEIVQPDEQQLSENNEDIGELQQQVEEQKQQIEEQEVEMQQIKEQLEIEVAQKEEKEAVVEKLPIKVYYGDSNAEFVINKTVYVDKLDENTIAGALVDAGVLKEDVKVQELSFEKERAEDAEDAEGYLTVDFNQAFHDSIGTQGSGGEVLAIKSIANTFLSAYQATHMKITVDGKPLETGHMVYNDYMKFSAPAPEMEYQVEVMAGAKENVDMKKIYCETGFAIGYDYKNFYYNMTPGSQTAIFAYNVNGENNADYASLLVTKHDVGKEAVLTKLQAERKDAELSTTSVKIGKNGESAQTLNYTESLVEGTKAGCVYILEHNGSVYTIDVSAMDIYQEEMTPRLQAMLKEFYFVD